MAGNLENDEQRQAELISGAVKAAFLDIQKNGGFCNKCCQFCEVTPQEHREHHQYFKTMDLEEVYGNHRTVNRIREVFRAIGDNTVRVLTVAGLSGIIASIWYYVIAKISTLK